MRINGDRGADDEGTTILGLVVWVSSLSFFLCFSNLQRYVLFLFERLVLRLGLWLKCGGDEDEDKVIGILGLWLIFYVVLMRMGERFWRSLCLGLSYKVARMMIWDRGFCLDIVYLQSGLEEFSFNPLCVNWIDYPHVLFEKVIWFIKNVMWLKVHMNSLFTCHIVGWRKIPPN